jgi:hypothetical protein
MLIRISFIITLAAVTAGATVPRGTADDPAGTGQDRFAASPKRATATFRGVVASVDESSNTIKIRGSSETTEEFKVQDGLLFDSVRYGDRVEVTVENCAGARTIVRLAKE